MLYCAIIGDIVKSKKLKEHRDEVQRKFKKVIAEINENSKYRHYIESRFTVTLGDEFQGLLNDAAISYEMILDIKEQMKPVEMVFGVGIGTMETPFDKEIAIGSDGPAYHYARKMCERAKKKKPSICYYSGSIEDELINASIHLIESLMKKRTENQLEIINLYNEGKNQKDIAKLLDKTQSTISRTLKNSFYEEITDAEKQIKRILESKIKSK